MSLSGRYLIALRAKLDGTRAGNGDSARGLGRAALAGGLATLDLAIMHERALIAVASSAEFAATHDKSMRRAGRFFTQALVPLETAQRAARKTNRTLSQRNETLRLHAAALAEGNRRLELEIRRRKSGEALIRKGKAEYQKLFLQGLVMQKKLRHLTRQIISAQEEERKMISRELHDEIVQTLVGINVELTALSKGASLGMGAMKAKIARTQRLVENSVNAVHRFARELRPAVLDDLGLIPALQSYCKALAERKHMRIKLTAFGGVEALASAKRTVLYRVAQEALTNVARHAQATHVKIDLAETAGGVRMVIRDNGKSFQVEKTLVANSNSRLGLVGMRERVEMVGGELTIESAPRLGTALCAEFPFNQGNQK